MQGIGDREGEEKPSGLHTWVTALGDEAPSRAAAWH